MTIRCEILDASQVHSTSKQVQEIARSIGFSDALCGKAAIIATEMATNLLKFAHKGEILIQTISRGDQYGIEIISIDSGPGIENVSRSFEDGYSSAGSAGTGLGAIKRLSSEMEVYSAQGEGMILVSRLFQGSVRKPSGYFTVASLTFPYPGEQLNGDGWSYRIIDGKSRFLLVDGLGHGLYAHEAADRAVDIFSAADGPLEDVLMRMHAALRSTRGAAASILEIAHESGEIRFAGVGNVSGSLLTPGTRHNLVSLPGTLGVELRKVTVFSYPSDILQNQTTYAIMVTDGIGTKWDINAYPGIFHKDPTILASLIYRDFHRKNDDCSVLVIHGNSQQVMSR